MTPQAQSLIDAVGKTTACNPVSSPGWYRERSVQRANGQVVPFSNPRPDQPTPREREILNYIWAGLTSQEIAARLRIAPKTVESHRANLLRKFRASNAAQLPSLRTSGRVAARSLTNDEGAPVKNTSDQCPRREIDVPQNSQTRHHEHPSHMRTWHCPPKHTLQRAAAVAVRVAASHHEACPYRNVPGRQAPLQKYPRRRLIKPRIAQRTPSMRLLHRSRATRNRTAIA